jgi:hypothetical protein
MAGAGHQRLLRVLRCADQLSGTARRHPSRHGLLASYAQTAQPEGPHTWERITKLAADYLPQPKTLHPWPQQRFAVRHPRWEPRAGIPLARLCAGGAQQCHGAVYREVRASYFPNKAALPASTLLQISRLANPAYLLEVEVIAILPPKT